MRRATARGRRLDLAVTEYASALPERDRAFVRELTYGVTRLQGRLDYLLARHVRRGLAGLEAPLLEVLRLGAYQLLYMDAVPDYAAVSQSVELARGVSGKGGAGLVNAVLRRVAETGDDLSLFPDFDTDPAAFLETWGSHPRWLVDRWLSRWTPAAVRRLVEFDNTPPDLFLVPLEHDAAVAAEHLARVGIAAEPVGRRSNCLRLARGSDPGRALEALPAVIQDPGANLVTVHADIPSGTKVADLCAAPGGKALVLSTRAEFVVAADPSQRRLHLVRENADRTRRRLGLVRADARRPAVAGADVVLVDTPCTGTGTLRRHPDGKWRLGPRDVEKMAALQSEILQGAASAVAPGGLLVYATCSLEPEENEERIAAFLGVHPEFRLEPGPGGGGDGLLRVLPQENGFDGAFAARLRRAS
ncbi:MAG: transcription antitermination factor NusB [Gemmatimonadota bacterium]